MSGRGDPKGDDFELKIVDPPAVEGWWIEVEVQGQWQLFKFTTIKKVRRVKEIIKGLKRSYGLKFKYSKGWKMSQQQEPSEETEIESQIAESIKRFARHTEERLWAGYDPASPEGDKATLVEVRGPDEDGTLAVERVLRGTEATREYEAIKEAEADVPANGGHYWHNGLCNDDCELDPRPDGRRRPVRGPDEFPDECPRELDPELQDIIDKRIKR